MPSSQVSKETLPPGLNRTQTGAPQEPRGLESIYLNEEVSMHERFKKIPVCGPMKILGERQLSHKQMEAIEEDCRKRIELMHWQEYLRMKTFWRYGIWS